MHYKTFLAIDFHLYKNFYNYIVILVKLFFFIIIIAYHMWCAVFK